MSLTVKEDVVHCGKEGVVQECEAPRHTVSAVRKQ